MATKPKPAPLAKRTVRRTQAEKSLEGRLATVSPGGSTIASAALVDVDKPLTEKQMLFARGWAQGDSISNATVRAGFADSSFGYKLSRMPNILAVYHREKAKYEEASQMTRQKVMDGLLEAVEMAKLMSEPATMVSGWREVGKMCGYYAPVEHRMKVDVSGNIVLDRLNSMSDAELLKVISGGTQNAGTQLLVDQTGVGDGDGN